MVFKKTLNQTVSDITSKMVKKALEKTEINKPFRFFENTVFIQDFPFHGINSKKYGERDPNKALADKIIKSVLKN